MINQVDLDQARSRRYFLVVIPTEAVGEAVNRYDLAERAARRSGRVADALDEVEAARLLFGRCFQAYPAHDFLRVGQKGEHGGGWGRDLGLAPDDKRFVHGSILAFAEDGILSPNPQSPNLTDSP